MVWFFKKDKESQSQNHGKTIINELIGKSHTSEKINGKWVSYFDYFDNKQYVDETEESNDKLAFKGSLETLINKMKINLKEINSEEDIIKKILEYKPKDEGEILYLDMKDYRLQYIIVKSRKINEPLSINLLIYLLTYEYIQHYNARARARAKDYNKDYNNQIDIEKLYEQLKNKIKILLKIGDDDYYTINDFMKKIYESLQNKENKENKEYGKDIKILIEKAYPEALPPTSNKETSPEKGMIFTFEDKKYVITDYRHNEDQRGSAHRIEARELGTKENVQTFLKNTTEHLEKVSNTEYVPKSGGRKRSSKKSTSKRKHRKSRNTKRNQKRKSRR